LAALVIIFWPSPNLVVHMSYDEDKGHIPDHCKSAWWSKDKIEADASWIAVSPCDPLSPTPSFTQPQLYRCCKQSSPKCHPSSSFSLSLVLTLRLLWAVQKVLWSNRSLFSNESKLNLQHCQGHIAFTLPSEYCTTISTCRLPGFERERDLGIL
jgi:hypothetical protein